MDNKQEQKILVNFEIKDPRVILFDKEGVKLGQVNLSEARKRAEDAELDLVQVAKTEQGVPICKILNFGAWKYHEQKKKHKQEIKNKTHELKEMWISPAIDDNDLKIKMQKCEAFLKEGHKVRIVLKVARGKKDQYRLIQNKEMSYALMNSAINFLKEAASIDTPTKGGPGGSLSVILKPSLKPVVKVEKNEATQPTTTVSNQPAPAPVSPAPTENRPKAARM